MQYTPQPLDGYYEIAEKVRSEEYFREAHYMYDITIHDPMAERYFYILITAISTLILLLVVIAANSLYPLEIPVPFIYNPRDIVDDIPHIKPLRADKHETPDNAVLRFMVTNYVVQREEYAIDKIDRNMNSIKLQSASDVYKNYEKSMDPRNPESPVTLYQRHSTRSVEVLSTQRIAGTTNEMEVMYEATVATKDEEKKTVWLANITFSYSGLGLDDNGNPKPISFFINQYSTKRLQDAR